MTKLLTLTLFLTLSYFHSNAQEIEFFQEGTPAKYGIRKGNTVIVSPQYDTIRRDTDGFTMASMNKKWGMIDHSGKIIIAFKYDKIESFIDGFAKVTINNKVGLVNTSGLEVIQPLYNSITDFKDGIAIAQRGEHKMNVPKNMLTRGAINVPNPVAKNNINTNSTTVSTSANVSKTATANNAATNNANNKSTAAAPTTTPPTNTNLSNSLLANTEYNLGLTANNAKNYVEAVKYFTLAANKGHELAMVRLGALYFQGSGVAKNAAEALKLFEKAGNLGNLDGMYFSGLLYESETFGSPNYKKAVEWYEKAVDKGHPNAMNNLGNLYYFGKAGINYDKAKQLYTKAAELGHEEAKKSLTALSFVNTPEQSAKTHYNTAIGLKAGGAHADAFANFKKAADLGNAEAMIHLADYYISGTGTAKNEQLALDYLNKAAKLDNDKAKILLTNMGKPVPQTTATATQKLAAAPLTPATPIINKNVPYLGKNGKYGLADRTGKVIVQPKYDGYLNFNDEGRAVASLELKEGLIDNNGKILVPIEYDRSTGGTEDRYIFTKRFLNGTSQITSDYVFDKMGNLLFTVENRGYNIDGPYYNGRALVKKDREYGYIDPSGKLVIPIQFVTRGIIGSATNAWFKDGAAAVTTQDGMYALIDVNGNMLTKKKYYSIARPGSMFDFSKTKVDPYFRYKNETEGKTGYLDNKGNEITPAAYTEANDFIDGMAMFATMHYTYGFINTQGKEIISPNYDYAYDFSEGLAVVKQESNYGAVDKTGKLVIPIKFEHIGKFREGLAIAKINGKFGVINKKGEWVVTPSFESTGPQFKDGVLGVRVNGLWGFINTKGEFLVRPKYEKLGLTDFHDGIKAMEVGKLYFVIDKNGREFREL